jgi:hypothetical protein
LFAPAVYRRRSTPMRSIRSTNPKPEETTPIEPTMELSSA